MDRPPFDVDRVLSRVEELLTDVDAGVSTLTPSASGKTPPVGGLGLEELGELLSPTRDAFADFRVSEENMVVHGDFYPPLGTGKPMVLDEVVYQLEKLGITNGVLIPVLKEVVADVDIERHARENVLIAAGTAPVDEIPERWEVLPELLERKRVLDDAALTVDYKTDTPFVLVKAGELLAFRIPEQFGSRGWDVYGHALEPARRNPRPLQAGKNVSKSEAGFRATGEGCLHIEGNTLSVDDVLVLDEGVSYQTGNIDFPGDIQILGPIASGFEIRTKGSIYSSQVMDVSGVVTGGNLVTQYGIVGKEGCRVTVGGTVRTKFLEQVVLQAQGLVFAQNSIHNSLVQTRDRVQLGERGVIMGGRIEAQNGIDVFQVGSIRSVKAELICGMDFEVTGKISWAQEKILLLVKQMKQLSEHAKAHPEQTAKIGQAMATLRSKITELSEISRDLAVQLDRNDEASVVVRGTVHMGTYVEICHVSFVVPKPMSRVRFSLDKKHGVVRAAGL